MDVLKIELVKIENEILKTAIKEVPHGGSEWVNQVLIDKFNLEFQYSNQVNSFDYDAMYVISNISLMNPNLINQIQNLNYIIIVAEKQRFCEGKGKNSTFI